MRMMWPTSPMGTIIVWRCWVLPVCRNDHHHRCAFRAKPGFETRMGLKSSTEREARQIRADDYALLIMRLRNRSVRW